MFVDMRPSRVLVVRSEDDLEVALPVPRSLASSILRAVGDDDAEIIPDEVAIRVHDSNANMRHLVMPMRPDGTDEQLASLATRDTMIGVNSGSPPSAAAGTPD